MWVYEQWSTDVLTLMQGENKSIKLMRWENTCKLCWRFRDRKLIQDFFKRFLSVLWEQNKTIQAKSRVIHMYVCVYMSIYDY